MKYAVFKILQLPSVCRKYATTIILTMSMLVGELHTFWEKNNKVENWIIKRHIPMTISWNVKYVLNELWPVFVFLSWFFYVPNKENKTTVKTFLFFTIIDVGMYFWNFKTYCFGVVYFILLSIWILIYYRKK